MDYIMYAIIAGFIIAFFIFQSISARKNEKRKKRENLEKNWGKENTRKYSVEELEKISYYYKKSIEKNFYIDDITWNDVDMDSVYKIINTSCSAIGDEYLYSVLRIPENSEEILKKRSRLATFFKENKNAAFSIREIFCSIGRFKKSKISIYEYISRLFELKVQGNGIHYILIILFMAAFAGLFIQPAVAIVLLIIMLAVNIGHYYKTKAKIDIYFDCFKYIVMMIKAGRKICELNIKETEEHIIVIKKACDELDSLTRGGFLISSGNVSGSLGDIILDYVRMIFHLDLIKFNSMQKCVYENIDQIKNLYKSIGELETVVSIASFREYLINYCEPEFKKEVKIGFENIYHPLINEPVKNDLASEKHVLLTGSNASGKSTFLKTVAISALLAQSIYTCPADKYSIPFCKIYSSMALHDNLKQKESYFVVEIKSLKRILSETKDDIPIICFIDEVLRGTNTVERISASSEILLSLSKENVICFAATHDIELTHILNDVYVNYHFTENISNYDVIFNYKLLKGRATSRNAIKLLGVIGYDKEIINAAGERAERFTESGIWK